MIFEPDHSMQGQVVSAIKPFNIESSRLFGILSDPKSWQMGLTPRIGASEFPSSLMLSFDGTCRVMLKLVAWNSLFTEVQISITGFQNDRERLNQEKYFVELFAQIEKRLGIEAPTVASAPGKVNVFFAVGSLSKDGYHEVASCYQALAIRERVLVEQSAKLEIAFSGTFAQLSEEHVPKDESNLVYKAGLLLQESGIDGDPNKVSFTINKGVPIAGGMAGGSADAAAALVALNALWAANMSEQLSATAATLGADVPFSLLGGTALGLGRGEKLSPIDTNKALHWVMSVSHIGLSTPEVYKKLDEIRERNGLNPGKIAKPVASEALVVAVASGDAESVAKLMQNDLEAAALELRPELRTVLDDGLEAGALRSMISGSGPTVAHLASDRIHAEQVASRLERRGHQTITTFSVTSGARLEG